MILATASVYWGAGDLGFLNYDDPQFVTANEMVVRGWTGESVRWAFTTGHGATWQPMTWLSHMTDVELFGDDPAGHHRTNVLLHTLTSLLLLWFLFRATGSLVPSTVVALLFALHPVQVESVAWVSERKGILSGLFGVATLAAYVEAVRRGGTWRWALTHGLFALGLMAKPVLVTWPLLLLLLDRWPLQRAASWVTLVREKLGLFALVAVSSIVAFVAQRQGGAVADLTDVALVDRFSNAAVSYTRYIGKLLWPVDLAVPYPHPALIPTWGGWTALQIAGSLVAILFVALAVWQLCRTGRRPQLAVGMLWFAGTLVPVLGLVQIGNHAMADRYLYLPAVGFFLAVVWSLHEAAGRSRQRQQGLCALAAVLVVVLGVQARGQTAVWTDSRSLFLHATQHTRDNWLAFNNLGIEERAHGRPAEAVRAYDRTVAIMGDRYAAAHYNRGNALVDLKRYLEAEASFRKALSIEPDNTEVLNNLARCLIAQRKPEAALAQLQRARDLEPENVGTRLNLGQLLASLGRFDQALAEIEAGLRHCSPSSELHKPLLGLRARIVQAQTG